MRRFLLFPLTRIVLAAGVIFLPFIALQLALDASGRNLPGWGDAALITALSVLALWILARFIEGRALSEVGLARTGAVWQTLLGFGVGAPLLNTRLDGPALWTGGSFGPEASLVTVLLCTAVGAAFLVVAVRRGRMVPFRWRRRAAAAGSAATPLPPS